MANPDNPSGLTPVCYMNGAPYNGQCQEFETLAGDAAQILIGDPVKLGGSSTSGYPTATLAAAGDTVVGVCVGVKPTDRDSSIYRAASSTTHIFVATDRRSCLRFRKTLPAAILRWPVLVLTVPSSRLQAAPSPVFPAGSWTVAPSQPPIPSTYRSFEELIVKITRSTPTMLAGLFA